MYVQIDDTVLTIEDYHAFSIPGCMTSYKVSAETNGPLFQITVDNVINLRACASTSCDLLGRAQAGGLFDVVGEDGDWYEIAFEDGTAFIAAWLTRVMVDPPTGLLTDFQFAALNPYEYFSDILHGTTCRIGRHCLNLKRKDGSPAAYELQAMNWGIDSTTETCNQTRFFGWGKPDWTALPYLLPESSFDVYVVREQKMYELPISNYSHVDSYNLGFEAFERQTALSPARKSAFSWRIVSRPIISRIGLKEATSRRLSRRPPGPRLPA